MEVKLFGKRFKQIREHLGYSQVQIAEIIDSTQNIVSRLERGHGAGINTFLKLLKFYADKVYLDCIFEDNFVIVTKDEEDFKKDDFKEIVRGLRVQKLISNAYKSLDDAKKQIVDVKKKLKDVENDLK